VPRSICCRLAHTPGLLGALQQIEEWLWNAIAYDFTLAYAEMLWAHDGAFLTAVTLAPTLPHRFGFGSAS